MTEKQLYYFLAIKDILELFAEQELGCGCEINIPAVISYTESAGFINDSWGLYSKEEIYQLVTDDILDGYPVWMLLDIPEWTKNMLEREYNNEVKKQREEYKCYTCEYFSEHMTDLGMLMKCKRPKDWNKTRETFSLKKKCKYYKENIE